MWRTLDRGMLAAIGLLTTLLLVNAVLAYRNTRQLNEDAGWVAHTHEVLDLTGDVLLTLVDAETGERGFLITGKEEFLQPYREALARLDRRLAALKDKTRDSAPQQANLHKLEAMIAARLALLKEAIDLRRHNPKALEKLAGSGRGKRQMDAIRDLVASMRQDELDLLRQREAQSRRAYQVAVTTGLLSAALGLLFVAAFVWLLARSLAARQRAAAVLYQQREWFRTTLASIGDAVLATDVKGRVTFLNPVAQALTGWTEDEARGKPLDAVFHIVNEETRQAVESPVIRAFREGAVVGLANHTLLIARGGTGRPIDDSAAPILDAGGEVVGAVLIFRDVTERRRAAEALRDSQQRFARFMQHLPGLAWVKDLEGRYVYANEAAARAFRTAPAALYGKTDDEVFAPETAAQFRAHDQQALASGSGVQVVEELRHADGVVHQSLVSKFPIPGPDGRPALVGGMAIDISDRLKAEEALREADRRKDEFLATLAHELRNPLAPIRNAVHILKRPAADPAIAARARELLERQVHHLVRLVDDLLDVSRVMRGKVELRKEPVELSTVVARAVETAQPVIDAEGHALEVSLPVEPLWLDGDLVRLAQAFGNLLHNAAKYTERGGRIWLRGERQGDAVVVRVGDTGIGIAPDMLPHIFDMFVQADRRTKNAQGGMGIGLTLVRSLVERHGGTVTARSAGPGQGSEFVVTLPLLHRGAPKGEPSGAGEPGPAPRRAARKILVVDDNLDAAESLAVLLRMDGHDVRVAHDGAAALAQASADPPDVAFLDIGMPRMDGNELARRFRASPALQHVLLVAVTGWGQDEDRRRTQDAGFDHHLVKPVEPDALHQFLAD